MREATNEINSELVLEFCKAILNAETKEEMEAMKTAMPEYLRQNGADEETINSFLASVNEYLEAFEKQEMVFDENGQLVRTDNNIEQNAGTSVPSLTTFVKENTGMILKDAGFIFSVEAAAIVACLALKNKVLKNKKNKSR